MPQASPAARALANEHSIDLFEVKGTGKKNYITIADVKQAIEDTRLPEAAPPFIEPSFHEDFEFEDLSPEAATALLSGIVLPVSVLPKLRFRQDSADEQEWSGDDLLALRRKTAGGRYRSNDGILGWFVSDRGFFVDPVENPGPIDVELPPEAQKPAITELGDSFQVTE